MHYSRAAASGGEGASEHTPTPWSIKEKTLIVLRGEMDGDYRNPDLLVAVAKSNALPQFDRSEANARLIVTAVNAHATTLARVAELEGAITSALDRLFNNGRREGWLEIQQSAVNGLRAALAGRVVE